MEEQTQDFQANVRLKYGDLSGLDALMERYQLQAVRVAYLVVRNRQLAEDIVQNAFLRLVTKISQYDSARPFAPWFLRSVINDALKAIQRQKREVSLDAAETETAATLLDSLSNPQPNPEDLAERAEIRQAVWQALGALAPDQRVAIVQRYYLGYSETEMSTELQRPTGTIKWLLYIARRRLHSLLSAFAPSSAFPSVEPNWRSSAASEKSELAMQSKRIDSTAHIKGE